MSDNHGNTPAAWTCVSILMLAFVVSGIGLMVYSWLMFWIGAAMVPIGVAAGVVMAKRGLGAPHRATRRALP